MSENRMSIKIDIVSVGIILTLGIGALTCFGFILLDAFLFGEKLGIQTAATLLFCVAVLLGIICFTLFTFFKGEKDKKVGGEKMGESDDQLEKITGSIEEQLESGKIVLGMGEY